MRREGLVVSRWGILTTKLGRNTLTLKRILAFFAVEAEGLLGAGVR